MLLLLDSSCSKPRGAYYVKITNREGTTLTSSLVVRKTLPGFSLYHIRPPYQTKPSPTANKPTGRISRHPDSQRHVLKYTEGECVSFKITLSHGLNTN